MDKAAFHHTRSWPKLSKTWVRTIATINIFAVISFAYVTFFFHDLDCGNGACRDLGILFITRPDLLVTGLAAVFVPVIDAFIAVYLVGSKLGLGTHATRRLIMVILAGLALILLVARLLQIG